MSVTLEEVSAALLADEPDYNQASKLGPDAIVHLETLVSRSDPALASKAVYLASLITDQRSVSLVDQASRNSNPEIRAAAAAAARNLTDADASRILISLVDDEHPGIRKVALNAVPAKLSPQLRTKIENLAKLDEQPTLRALSSEVLQRQP